VLGQPGVLGPGLVPILPAVVRPHTHDRHLPVPNRSDAAPLPRQARPETGTVL
jgi:hypothetical protein